jgi:hypothetical protein
MTVCHEVRGLKHGRDCAVAREESFECATIRRLAVFHPLTGAASPFTIVFLIVIVGSLILRRGRNGSFR